MPAPGDIFGFDPYRRFATVKYRIAKGSLDHVIGAREQRRRHVEAERLGCLEIDDKFELGGKLDRQVAGRGTFEDFVDVDDSAPIGLSDIDPIARKPAGNDTAAFRKDQRQAQAIARSTIRFCPEFNNPFLGTMVA
jgi:hypothetical protein